MAEMQTPYQPGTPPMQPHRGVLILVFGILGVVCCVILGILAWVWGNQDKAAMQAGTMDRSGEGLTEAGRILGMVSVGLAVLWVVLAATGVIGTALFHPGQGRFG